MAQIQIENTTRKYKYKYNVQPHIFYLERRKRDASDAVWEPVLLVLQIQIKIQMQIQIQIQSSATYISLGKEEVGASDAV